MVHLPWLFAELRCMGTFQQDRSPLSVSSLPGCLHAALITCLKSDAPDLGYTVITLLLRKHWSEGRLIFNVWMWEMLNTCHHSSIAILVAAWKRSLCALHPSWKQTCIWNQSAPDHRLSSEYPSKTFCLPLSVFCNAAYSFFFFVCFIVNPATLSVSKLALCLLDGSQSFQKEPAVWGLLTRRSEDLLFLTGTTTKDTLLPREGGWLRSPQRPALWFGTLRSCLFVWRIHTQSLTHTQKPPSLL